MAETVEDVFIAARHHEELGDAFYDAVEPARFPAHILRWRNRRWAERVGLGGLPDEDWIAHFGRFEPLPGSLDRPLALRYHGHQFRSYNPQLGDGRGFLFAQLRDPVDGRLLDLATKGSGETPWSRGADGRLTLKGGVREVLATQLLEARGVDTSKSFSLIETGENLYRGDEPSPTRSSVLVRLSHSHIRIGTFQRLAYLNDEAGLRRLIDHSIRYYMPDLWPASIGGRGDPDAGLPGAGLRQHRPHGGGVDGGRIRPRRHQFRQRDDHGRKLRLRSLPVPGRIRPEIRRGLFRPYRALRLWPAARSAAVEPDPIGGMPDAVRISRQAGSRPGRLLRRLRPRAGQGDAGPPGAGAGRGPGSTCRRYGLRRRRLRLHGEERRTEERAEPEREQVPEVHAALHHEQRREHE